MRYAVVAIALDPDEEIHSIQDLQGTFDGLTVVPLQLIDMEPDELITARDRCEEVRCTFIQDHLEEAYEDA